MFGKRSSPNHGTTTQRLRRSSSPPRLDSSRAILVVATQGNSPELQVRTGVLLQKLWMEVLSAGGSLLPLSQALQEYPEMEELHEAIQREVAQPGETVQMLLSLGKPKGIFLRSPRISTDKLARSEVIFGGGPAFPPRAAIIVGRGSYERNRCPDIQERNILVKSGDCVQGTARNQALGNLFSASRFPLSHCSFLPEKGTSGLWELPDRFSMSSSSRCNP